MALKHPCPEKAFGVNKTQVALNGFGSPYRGVEQRAQDVIVLIPGEGTSPFPVEELLFNWNYTYHIDIDMEVLTGHPSGSNF